MISTALNSDISAHSQAHMVNNHACLETVAMTSNHFKYPPVSTGGMVIGEDSNIWTEDVENAFLDAYEFYPPTGRSKIRTESGQLMGRNELISQYIFENTGKVRTRKQVSSHIQVLLKKHQKFSGLVLHSDDDKPVSLRQASQMMQSELLLQQQNSYINGVCSVLNSQTGTPGFVSPHIKSSDIDLTGLPSPITQPNSPRAAKTVIKTRRSEGKKSPRLSTPISSPELKQKRNSKKKTTKNVNSPSITHSYSRLDMLLSAAIYTERNSQQSSTSSSSESLPSALEVQPEPMMVCGPASETINWNCAMNGNGELEVSCNVSPVSGQQRNQDAEVTVEVYQLVSKFIEYKTNAMFMETSPLQQFLNEHRDLLFMCPNLAESLHIRITIDGRLHCFGVHVSGTESISILPIVQF